MISVVTYSRKMEEASSQIRKAVDFFRLHSPERFLNSIICEIKSQHLRLRNVQAVKQIPPQGCGNVYLGIQTLWISIEN